MPTSISRGKPAVADNETISVPALRILSSSATGSERNTFIRSHVRAAEACGRRRTQHAWLAGRELTYLREKDPGLRGRSGAARAWVAFLKKNCSLGERQAYDLMRIHNAFPSMKSIPKGVESIRGAIAHLKAKTPSKRRRSPVARPPTAPNREVAKVATANAHAMLFAGPRQTPRAARVREQLRTTQRWLAEIATSDAAAFMKMRDVIRRQHARTCPPKKQH